MSQLTERQLYALAHPVADPVQMLDDVGLWDAAVLKSGNILRSALAIDR